MGLGAVSGVALLLLGLFAAPLSDACRVSGPWETIKNSNKGIRINIRPQEDGLFSGTYFDAGASTESNLTGYQQAGQQPTFGFTVKSSTSATIVHMGHCYVSPDGESILITTKFVKEPSTYPKDFPKYTATAVNFTRIYVA
ncbi:uncharacterized protein LOC144819183 isoform X2 [Lissotriton helveticus]